jgi:hypothetical protein
VTLLLIYPLTVLDVKQFAPESDKDSMGSNLGLADDDDYDDSASKISSIIRERDSSSAAVATSAAAVGAAAIGAAESSSLRKKRKSKKEMLNEKNVEQQVRNQRSQLHMLCTNCRLCS